MIAFCRNLYSARRAALLAVFSLVFAAAWTFTVHAGARDEATPALTPPYAMFQNATITGAGNTITVTQLPVVTTNGTTNTINYDNVTIQFDVAADGTLTVSSGYPVVIASARGIVSSFRAGSYTGPSNQSNFIINVSGPGVATAGNTVWTLAAASGGNGCTYPASATWYVGPLAMNPLMARIKKAGIPTTTGTLFFGVSGSQTCGGGGNWNSDTLLGLSQSGKTMTISSYTHDSGDSNLPFDQITYTTK